MLTRLRFKNWRSLRDVTIDDLKPITVFIGANSSGKTNIVDGLDFLRESSKEGALRAIQNRGGAERVHTVGIDSKEPVEIEFSFRATLKNSELTYMLGLEFEKSSDPFPNVAESLEDESTDWLKAEYGGRVRIRHREEESLNDLPDPPFGWDKTVLSVYGNVPSFPEIYETFQFITERWQLLDENFMPPLSVPFDKSGDLYVIDKYADNLPIMLDFMKGAKPDLYAKLRDDLQWLLTHIDKLLTVSDERETRFLIREKTNPDSEAPTLSAGSARLIAMLTAFYALDMRVAEMPGLVVIEEPDTALNPGVLRNFAEQLRYFTTGEHPRQVILTTHNPVFLDYFEPEEVRVVTRDDNGYTSVKRIPESVKEIWLDEYGLGEVWRTNSFGGLP